MLSRYKVSVCRGPTCGDRRDSAAIAAEFTRLIAVHESTATVCWHSCFGKCRSGPNVLVQKVKKERKYVLAQPPLSGGGPATMYNGVTTADVSDIVEQHLGQGRPVKQRIGDDSREPSDAKNDGDL